MRAEEVRRRAASRPAHPGSEGRGAMCELQRPIATILEDSAGAAVFGTCDKTAFKNWKAVVGGNNGHWIIPVWYLTAIEQVDEKQVRLRCQPATEAGRLDALDAPSRPACDRRPNRPVSIAWKAEEDAMNADEASDAIAKYLAGGPADREQLAKACEAVNSDEECRQFFCDEFGLAGPPETTCEKFDAHVAELAEMTSARREREMAELVRHAEQCAALPANLLGGSRALDLPGGCRRDCPRAAGRADVGRGHPAGHRPGRRNHRMRAQSAVGLMPGGRRHEAGEVDGRGGRRAAGAGKRGASVDLGRRSARGRRRGIRSPPGEDHRSSAKARPRARPCCRASWKACLKASWPECTSSSVGESGRAARTARAFRTISKPGSLIISTRPWRSRPAST